MKKKRIALLWQNYESLVLPPIIGPIQRSETRRAFYAGAYALFTAMVTGVSPGLVEIEEDMTMMDDIQAELLEFASEIAAGRKES